MFEISISFSMDKDGKARIDYGTEKVYKKTREFKGISVNKHVDDYCVVDLETTGVFVGSAKIIEISAIKVRNNEIVSEYSTLVNPKCHIPEEATAVNHITDDMVNDAPALDDIIDEFMSFVDNDVIIGYNNAGFDMNILYDAILEIRSRHFTNNYLDMLHAVRRSLPELKNSKLETVSNFYGLDTFGEHRALKDCYLTKSCYDKLYEQFGDIAFKKTSRNKSSGKGVQYSYETIALKELQKNLECMLGDGQITVEEADSLRCWIEEHRDLLGSYPFDKIFSALDKVLEDGQITEEELYDLKIVFQDVIDPVKSNGSHDSICTLFEKHVCLTGEFNYGTKSEVEKLIHDVGGIIDKNVKKATDYVVVGAQGSDAWKAGNYGGKIQKAMEWNEKGKEIRIIEENDFIPLVQNLIENVNVDDNRKEMEEYDWKTLVQNMLDAMVAEEELPENSLRLIANYGRDGEKITSYSVCICEPDYPLSPNSKKDYSKNSIVLNIKENDSNLELMVGIVRFGELEIPKGAIVKDVKSDNNNVHLILPIDSIELVDYIKKNVKYAYTNYTSKAASFGCCSQFNAC